MKRLTILLPLILAAGLIAVFAAALLSGRDSQTIPSALLNRPVPEFNAPRFNTADDKPLTAADLKSPSGTVSLLNIWASWCTPCLAEHPYISDLAAQDHIQLIGLNYKDTPEAAQRFLDKHGNPYSQIGIDTDGAIAIDLGLYGVPETYVIDDQGIIRHKVVGPVTPDVIKTELAPLIEQLTTGAN